MKTNEESFSIAQFLAIVVIGVMIGLLIINIHKNFDSWSNKIQVLFVQEGDKFVVPKSHACGFCDRTAHYGKKPSGETTCKYNQGDTLVVKGKTDDFLVFRVNKAAGSEVTEYMCKQDEHILLSHEQFITLKRYMKEDKEDARRDLQIKQIVDRQWAQ